MKLVACNKDKTTIELSNEELVVIFGTFLNITTGTNQFDEAGWIEYEYDAGTKEQAIALFDELEKVVHESSREQRA